MQEVSYVSRRRMTDDVGFDPDEVLHVLHVEIFWSISLPPCLDKQHNSLCSSRMCVSMHRLMMRDSLWFIMRRRSRSFGG